MANSSEPVEHLIESLELIQDDIDWMLANDWSKEWFKEKLKSVHGQLGMVRDEVIDLGFLTGVD